MSGAELDTEPLPRAKGKSRSKVKSEAEPAVAAAAAESSQATGGPGTSPPPEPQVESPFPAAASSTGPVQLVPASAKPTMPRWGDMASEADSACSAEQARLYPDAPPFVPGAGRHIGLCQFFAKRGWCRFGDHCHQPHARRPDGPLLDVSENTRRSRRGGIKSIQARAAKRGA